MALIAESAQTLASESGKGFVASEAKELARGATTRATVDISQKIEAILASTRNAMDVNSPITATIESISISQQTIASAVEEQTASTTEISRNVREGATATSEIARNISSVAQAAELTSADAVGVRKT